MDSPEIVGWIAAGAAVASVLAAVIFYFWDRARSARAAARAEKSKADLAATMNLQALELILPSLKASTSLSLAVHKDPGNLHALHDDWVTQMHAARDKALRLQQFPGIAFELHRMMDELIALANRPEVARNSYDWDAVSDIQRRLQGVDPVGQQGEPAEPARVGGDRQPLHVIQPHRTQSIRHRRAP